MDFWDEGSNGVKDQRINGLTVEWFIGTSRNGSKDERFNGSTVLPLMSRVLSLATHNSQLTTHYSLLSRLLKLN